MASKTLVVTSDYVFKKLFRRLDIVKGFFEQILVGNGKVFPEGASLSNLSSDSEFRFFVEVKVQLETVTHKFIVEVQKRIKASKIFLKQVQHFGAQAIAKQMNSPLAYLDALPVIVIAVVDFVFDGTPAVSYHKTFEMISMENTMNFLTFIFVELSKYQPQDSDPDNGVHEWMNLMSKRQFDGDLAYYNPVVKEAATMVKLIWEEQYDEYQKHFLNEQAMLDKVASSAHNEAHATQASNDMETGEDEDKTRADSKVRMDGTERKEKAASEENADLKRRLASQQLDVPSKAARTDQSREH